MKRSELEKLGLSKEHIDAIMAEHGKSVEEHKSAAEAQKAEIDRLSKELSEAGKAIEGFKALKVEDIQKAADEYKAKYEKSEADRAAEKKAAEKNATAREILSGMKPKSKLVEKAALNDLLAALDDPKFKAEKWAKEYAEANAEDFGEPKGSGGMRHEDPPKNDGDDAKIRKAMGLPEKKA
jgi:predicted  nucleic acid-binding Zn-ribbon protein